MGEVNQKFTADTAKASRSVLTLVQALGELLGISDKTTKALKDTADAAEKAGDSTKKMGEDAEEGGKGATKMQSRLGKLLTSMKRIAFYRAIRSAIRSITDGLREGVQHVYAYSASLNSLDAARAKNTMDSFATSAMFVKNSLGAALMPILQSLVPIVNWIADAFVVAANAVNQFWSALQGKSVFTKATKQTVEFENALGGAAGAAKELKKQVFGFDELNIFDKPSSGGGGGGTPGLDFSKMFEESEIDNLFKRIRKRIDENLGKDFMARFKINWEEITGDWSGLNGEDVAKKILAGFYTVMFGVTGFTIAGPLGAIVGTLLGVTLGVGFATITFNDDGQVSSDELAEMLKKVAVALTGAVVGWSIGGPKGALLGMSIAAALDALVTTFSPKPGMTEMGLTFTGLLFAVIKSIVAGSGVSITTAAGLGIGSASTLGLGVAGAILLTIINLADLKRTVTKAKDWLGLAIASMMTTMFGVIGALTFGWNAGLAITVAAGLSIVITRVFTNYTAESKRQLEKGINTPDIANMEAYLQFGTPAGTSPNDGKSNAANKARGRADGGFVPAGTYFYAGEAGPELVGVVGGRTNVTNQDQFTAGMVDIMDNTNSVIMQGISALIQAIQSKPVPSIRIGDRDIVSAYDRGKTLAGGSLVE